MRVLLAFVAGAQVVLAVMFAVQVPLATELWPFRPTSTMTYLFLAAILAAAAASVGWCLIERSERGLTGIALDYLALMIPLSALAFVVAAEDADASAARLGLVSLGAAAFGAYLLRWSLGRPWRRTPPTPRLVVGSFMVFVAALVLAGTSLVLGVKGVLPWAASPEVSRIIGLQFLGAAAYFAYGLVDRRWENAGGQLAGFLAYDLVLAVPLLSGIVSGQRSYYDTSGEPLRLNLLAYAAIIIYSATVAAYYLFIAPRTRLGPLRRPADAREDRTETPADGRGDAEDDYPLR